MDKLKPLLKHYFWALFVLALLIPTLGWWTGASGYVTTINEQKTKIDAAIGSVPASATSKPNSSWVVELNKLIPEQEKRNKESAEFLWQQQKKNFFWPGPLQSHLPVKHRGDFAPIACDLYRNEYRTQREYVWRSCDPVDPAVGKGTVFLNPSLIPNRAWPLIPPVSKEIWEAQEDLWLLKSLMDVVKQMNAGSSSVNESPLRMVKTLILTGGDGTKVPSGVYATAATDGSSEGGAPPANFASDEGGASGGSANFSFPYTSELGIGGDGNKTVGGGDYASLDAGAEVSVDGAAAAEKPGLRYVGPQEGDVLSLQRGFYMEVVIDHRKIQDFIVNLTNCSFPVKINRYQFAIRNNLNPLATRKLAAPNPFARRGAVPGVAELPKTSSESAMSASYLANLAICGQMAIFTPPAHLPEATGPIPADPNAQPAATTPTTETSTPPTEMPAETPTPDKPATSDAPPASQEGGNPPVINNGSPGSPMQEENKAPMAPNEKPLEDKIPVEKIPAEKSPSTEPTPPNQPTETPPAAS